MAAEEWVKMEHPKVKGPPAVATREALEKAYEPLGWKEVKEESKPDAPPLQPEAMVDVPVPDKK